MADTQTAYIVPSAVIIFSVIVCVCVRISRRRLVRHTAVPVFPNAVSQQVYSPVTPYSVSVVPVVTMPVRPQPSAPPVSSDVIVFPYMASAPPEPITYAPTYPVTYPSTYPTTHIPLTQVTDNNRIYWSTGQPTV